MVIHFYLHTRTPSLPYMNVWTGTLHTSTSFSSLLSTDSPLISCIYQQQPPFLPIHSTHTTHTVDIYTHTQPYIVDKKTTFYAHTRYITFRRASYLWQSNDYNMHNIIDAIELLYRIHYCIYNVVRISCNVRYV